MLDDIRSILALRLLQLLARVAPDREKFAARCAEIRYIEICSIGNPAIEAALREYDRNVARSLAKSDFAE